MLMENTLYQVAFPKGEIPDDAFKGVRRLLPKNRQEFLDDCLRYDKVHWTSWIQERGPVAGTWPKRFARAWFKKYKTNVSPEELASIGSYLGKVAKDNSRTFYFDYEKQANWKPGAFKEDAYSCWWDDYNHARTGLIRRGGGAILFYESPAEYKKSKGVKGIGRAWIFTQARTHIKYIFNAYGFELATVARVVATAIGESYQWAAADLEEAYTNGDAVYAIGSTAQMAKQKNNMVCLDFADERGGMDDDGDD